MGLIRAYWVALAPLALALMAYMVNPTLLQINMEVERGPLLGLLSFTRGPLSASMLIWGRVRSRVPKDGVYMASILGIVLLVVGVIYSV